MKTSKYLVGLAKLERQRVRAMSGRWARRCSVLLLYCRPVLLFVWSSRKLGVGAKKFGGFICENKARWCILLRLNSRTRLTSCSLQPSNLFGHSSRVALRRPFAALTIGGVSALFVASYRAHAYFSYCMRHSQVDKASGSCQTRKSSIGRLCQPSLSITARSAAAVTPAAAPCDDTVVLSVRRPTKSQYSVVRYVAPLYPEMTNVCGT